MGSLQACLSYTPGGCLEAYTRPAGEQAIGGGGSFHSLVSWMIWNYGERNYANWRDDEC